MPECIYGHIDFPPGAPKSRAEFMEMKADLKTLGDLGELILIAVGGLGVLEHEETGDRELFLRLSLKQTFRSSKEECGVIYADGSVSMREGSENEEPRPLAGETDTPICIIESLSHLMRSLGFPETDNPQDIWVQYFTEEDDNEDAVIKGLLLHFNCLPPAVIGESLEMFPQKVATILNKPNLLVLNSNY